MQGRNRHMAAARPPGERADEAGLGGIAGEEDVPIREHVRILSNLSDLCRFLSHLSFSPSLYHLLLVLSHRYEFYRIYLCRFGDLLTDMEANGIRVDETHLRAAEVRAREEREAMQKLFIEWAALHCEDAAHINTASPAQIGMLLFGEWENGKRIATEKTFKIGKDDEEYLKEHTAVLLENPYAQVTTSVFVCVFTSTYRTLTRHRPFPS